METTEKPLTCANCGQKPDAHRWVEEQEYAPNRNPDPRIRAMIPEVPVRGRRIRLCPKSVYVPASEAG